MYRGRTTLALIPARGGSKGLPRKNLYPFAGKPLIAWSVEQALAAGAVDRVVVSTDDEEIARVALALGADVPFMRPSELASDTASSADVVLHALDWIGSNEGQGYDAIVLIEPTSPLRESKDIDECIRLLYSSDAAEAVVSVAPLESMHPSFAVALGEDGLIRSIDGDTSFSHLRRQDLSPMYFFDGTVYASTVAAFRERRAFYHDRTVGMVVERWKSLEIDDVYDAVAGDAIMRYRQRITGAAE